MLPLVNGRCHDIPLTAITAASRWAGLASPPLTKYDRVGEGFVEPEALVDNGIGSAGHEHERTLDDIRSIVRRHQRPEEAAGLRRSFWVDVTAQELRATRQREPSARIGRSGLSGRRGQQGRGKRRYQI
jgi:hypothetical protein